MCDEKFEGKQIQNPQDEVAKVETAKTKDSVAGAAADAMGARQRRGERGRASNKFSRGFTPISTDQNELSTLLISVYPLESAATTLPTRCGFSIR